MLSVGETGFRSRLAQSQEWHSEGSLSWLLRRSGVRKSSPGVLQLKEGFSITITFKCTLRAVLLVAELGLLTPSVVLVVVAVLVMVVAVQ